VSVHNTSLQAIGDLRDPVRVYPSERCTGVFALLSLERPNQNAIGREEVRDGSSLGKELGVGQNIEATIGFRVCLKNGAHRLGSAAWYS